jgi:hypothetical protein
MHEGINFREIFDIVEIRSPYFKNPPEKVLLRISEKMDIYLPHTRSHLWPHLRRLQAFGEEANKPTPASKGALVQIFSSNGYF